MAVRLYFDVHVDKAIHDQLHLRGVDVLRAQDDGTTEMTDEDLLQRSTDLGRLMFTKTSGSRRWPKTGNEAAGRSRDCVTATSWELRSAPT
jgi:hypothetical protein